MVKEVVRKECDTDGGLCYVVRLYRCEICGKEYKESLIALQCEKSHNRKRRNDLSNHPFDPLAPKYL